jgi:hypothetical protein
VFLSLVSEACFVLYSTHYDEKRLKSMVDSSQEFPGEKNDELPRLKAPEVAVALIPWSVRAVLSQAIF